MPPEPGEEARAEPPLADLYDALEAEPAHGRHAGTLERRILTNSPCDLFVGAQKPSNVRSLRARFRGDALPTPFDMPAFRGLELTERRGVEDGAERLTVVLTAPDSSYNDVFTALAEDIRHVAAAPASERDAAAAFRRRLFQWQRLLQKQGAEGLTAEEQRGLYGELWFLRHHLLSRLSAQTAVAGWTGPDAAAKDFELPGAQAFEVKTTLSRLPQDLEITGERQLDETGFAVLYLYHLAVEAARGAGETLADAVEALQVRMGAADPAARALLDEKLLDAGYHVLHVGRYRDVGYIVRAQHLYEVRDGFPRLRQGDLPEGVGALRYRISGAACAPFAVPMERLPSLLEGGEAGG